VFYRQLILKRLISVLDECGDHVQVPTLSKNINVLDALMWIATAWKSFCGHYDKLLQESRL
jgi:hypothetical protein